MKLSAKLKWPIAILLVFANAQLLFAQLTKADVFDEKTPITWLGIDFSLTKFIGSANQGSIAEGVKSLFHKKDDAADDQITNTGFRDTYTTAWNQLFVDEIKKYDVAKAVHRESVKYALDVAIKSNKALTNKDFFSNNPSDFKRLTEDSIAAAVKKYDFQNNDGIGLIFFVEGMSKGLASAGMWVTFVNIKTKTVLLTKYQTAKPGGAGFKNYWARTFYLVIKDMESDFKKWKNS